MERSETLPRFDIFAGYPSNSDVHTADDWQRLGAIWLPPQDPERFHRFVPREGEYGLDAALNHSAIGFDGTLLRDWINTEFDVDVYDVLTPATVSAFARELGRWLRENPEGNAVVNGIDTGIAVQKIRSLQFFVEISVRQHVWWHPTNPIDVPDW